MIPFLVVVPSSRKAEQPMLKSLPYEILKFLHQIYAVSMRWSEVTLLTARSLPTDQHIYPGQQTRFHPQIWTTLYQ